MGLVYQIYRRCRLLLPLAAILLGLNCSPDSIFYSIINGREILLDLKITPKKKTFALVDGQRLIANGLFENGDLIDLSNQVVWEASAPGVGYVQSDGAFQAISVGETVITATFEDFKARSQISVRKNAGVIYVDGNYEDGFNDGSPAKPFVSVKQAVDVATDRGSAQVLVAKGNYFEDTIIIQTDLELLGGYNTGETAEDWLTDVELELLDEPEEEDTGEDEDDDDEVDPADLVNRNLTTITTTGGTAVRFQNGVADAKISGFTITGGQSFTEAVAIGISVEGASPNISNNNIDGGLAASNSIGIAINSGAPKVRLNKISGGSSAFVSAGMTISNNAAPEVRKNYIYAGSSTNTNVSILNQNARPLIIDNPVISSDNETGTASPATHVTILNQAFSSPQIKGGVDGEEFPQVITGPDEVTTGSFRIKNEGSSGGEIDGNTIDAGELTAIFLDASSPDIRNNQILADDDDVPCIVAETISSEIDGNSIEGMVTIGEGSTDVVISDNFIAGSLTITGASTSITISGNIEKNGVITGHHYPLSDGNAQIASIDVEETSQADITGSATGRIRYFDASTGTISDNYIYSVNATGIYADGAVLEIKRNFIETIRSVNAGDGVRGIELRNIASPTVIASNLVYAMNTYTGPSDSPASALRFTNTSEEIVMVNNMFVARSAGTGGDTTGVRYESYGAAEHSILLNNIIFLSGANTATGYYDGETGLQPAAFAGNYFDGYDTVINEAGDTTYTANAYDLSDDADITDGIYQYNIDSVTDPLWAFLTAAGGSYADLEACIAADSDRIFNCDLNPAMGSDFIQKARTGFDLTADVADNAWTNHASPDLYGNCRNTIAGNLFAVGPVEYSDDIISCP